MSPVDMPSRVNENVGARTEPGTANAWNEIRESMNAYMGGINPQMSEAANTALINENTLPTVALEHGQPPAPASAVEATYSNPYESAGTAAAYMTPSYEPTSAGVASSNQYEPAAAGGSTGGMPNYEAQYMQNNMNSAVNQYNQGMTSEGYAVNGGPYGGYQNGTGGNVTDSTGTGNGSTGSTGSTSTISESQAQSQLTTAESKMSAKSVNQGDYGDCFFDSAVSAEANTAAGRKQLASEIKVNPDGSYSVTFPGDNSDPITVSNQEISSYNLTNKNLEANVLEAAFLKGNGIQPGDTGSNDFANAPIQYPEQAEQLLTGQNANFAWTEGQSNSQLASTIEGSLNSGKIITATSNDSYSGAASNNPIVGDHQYTILGYNPTTGTVTMRNPWGDETGTAIGNTGSTADGVTNDGNGVVTMSMSNFAKYFVATDAET